MKGLKLLSVGLLSFASGLGAYVIAYKNRLDKIVDNLSFDIADVENFKISTKKLSADIYLRAKNNLKDGIAFSNSKYVFFNEIRVYENSTDKFLAVSDLSEIDIIIKPNGSFLLPKIIVEISLLEGAFILLSALQNNTGDFVNRLRFEVDIIAFNKTQTIHF